MPNNKATKKITLKKRDNALGFRVRHRRQSLQISQTELSKLIGLTSQQIQKYEQGTNTISASRLADFSRALSISVNYFFADLFEKEDLDIKLSSKFKDLTLSPDDIFLKKESKELLKNYHSIPDRKTRKSIFEMVRLLAQRKK
jgi:transcriptional regulator with XRE-family HTH domain